MHFPEPRNIKDVQMFLGLTGYFRKFIEFYSIIAKPLTDLLQKNKSFSFNITEKEAFNKLKELLSKNPVLSIFNSKLETEMHTDACRDGYSAILFNEIQMTINCTQCITLVAKQIPPNVTILVTN